MKKKVYIKQPNHVSTARYELSALEKNILYNIIDELQKNMSMNRFQEYKEQEITIELKKIDKNNNYSRVKKAIKGLISKPVDYNYNISIKGKDSEQIAESITALVASADFIPKSQYITFFIPPSACRFFCYLGGGFTSFQKTIAISLSSTYSKSLYELCCRWSDKGGYSCTIKELKKYLSISDKYKQIAHLRNKVLNVAEKELKQKADLFFTYSLKKAGASRSYTDISIKIHRNTSSKNEYYGVREEHYASVYSFLNRCFPNYIDDKALIYSESLATSGNLDKAYSRFIRLDDEFASGSKTKADICNLLLKVILPEMGVITKVKNKNHTQLKVSVN
ncbi:replication initiation protein [Aquimarina macrocephali]|uniref:replication initiation protein n=1 Tax=Aquimarina macrocephali TaxID=666563 RepID=UPI003F665EBD